MYNFYIGNMALPVTPQKLTVQIKGNNKTLDLANERSVNFLRAPGLTEISFDAMLPMLGRYSFSGEYKRPDYYLNAFEKLMSEKKPFRFIVSRASPSGKLLYDTNIKTSLESYTIVEDASKGFDVTVQIKLKQYVDYATKIVKSANSAGSKSSRDAGSSPSARTYTVKPDDCLWNIAKKYYGDGTQYVKIYDANRDKISNPHLIYSGQVFTIP